MTTASHIEGRDHVSLFSAIGHWWKDMMAQQQEADMLDALGPDQVERMAHDLGMTADDLHDLAAHGVHGSDEAPHMIEALGMDPEDVQHNHRAVYLDVLRNCTHCDAKRRCARELKNGEAKEHYEEYCINAYTLDALRAIAAAPRAAA